MLQAAAHGDHPPPDGFVEVMPSPAALPTPSSTSPPTWW